MEVATEVLLPYMLHPHTHAQSGDGTSRLYGSGYRVASSGVQPQPKAPGGRICSMHSTNQTRENDIQGFTVRWGAGSGS